MKSSNDRIPLPRAGPSILRLSGRCRRRATIVAVLAALFCPASFGAATLTDNVNLPSLGDSDRQSLSPLTERKLGETIMRDIRRNPDYLDDAPTLEYMNDFGNQLLAARPEARGEASFDYFFFVVRDPMLNAFALPGGFIAAHSALLLAAQSESELASVISHEIGHVAQRHIARMLGQQKQDMLIPLAGVILAVLAARANPDASAALVVGSEGVALQRQLNFSRDAEREADRVGLQILRDAGFETAGMVAFFGRMQTASSGYSEGIPAYLRSHPLTTERIADIQARTRDLRYRQHADTLDFQLIRARVRVLQDDTSQGWRDASVIYAAQLLQKTRTQTVAGKYGLSLVAYRRGDYAKARGLLQEARTALHSGAPRDGGESSVLDYLGIDLLLASGKTDDAVTLANTARNRFPLSRGLARRYADTLLAAGRTDDAIAYLRDQIQLYRQESELQEQLAKAYSAKGKLVLQHLALAEAYALGGSLPAAMDQLRIARAAPDASFYDQALVDARERDFEARWREELADSKRSK
ncbi:M48 family metalloprotease [Actimicrobium antarcticum]|uniref:M48 family metalloprotease n=1 Tax=Actimicrobium antarcticum TaxID=1051899 RepID=A0ABP7TE85_9BURK